MTQRDFKGKSLISFPNEYVCFDLETTSKYAKYAKITEIAAIYVKDGIILDEFSTLVNPNCRIPEETEKLNGITNEMVENAPLIEYIIPQFMSFIGDEILVGHNIAAFDINVLYDTCEKNGISLKNDFIDTLRIARMVLPSLDNHKLSTIAEYFSIDPGMAHRAKDDAITTIKCFELIRKTVTPVLGKVVVFIGAMFNMPRSQALQVVKNYGGTPEYKLSKRTNILVLGRGIIHDWEKQREVERNFENEKQKNQKVKIAQQYQKQGIDISIMSEDEFFQLINYKPKQINQNKIKWRIL